MWCLICGKNFSFIGAYMTELLESYVYYWFQTLFDSVPSIYLSYSFPFPHDNALQALWSNGHGEKKAEQISTHAFV